MIFEAMGKMSQTWDNLFLRKFLEAYQIVAKIYGALCIVLLSSFHSSFQDYVEFFKKISMRFKVLYLKICNYAIMYRHENKINNINIKKERIKE